MKNKVLSTLAVVLCIGCCSLTDSHADDMAGRDAESHREDSINGAKTVSVVADQPFRLICWWDYRNRTGAVIPNLSQ